MKRLAIALFVLAAMISPALVLSQTVNFIGSNISVGASKLASGSICLMPVDNNNHPVIARLGGSGGGALLTEQACATITNGVIQSGFKAPDTALTSPLNVCLRVTITDSAQNGRPFYTSPCAQPASSGQSWCTTSGGVTTCNFDQYTPNVAPQALVQLGPQGIPGPGSIDGLSSNGSHGINVTGAVAAGTMISASTPMIDPRFYGAKCDGTTTGVDQAGFTAAHAKAVAMGGGTILVPGVCLMSSTFTITQSGLQMKGIGGGMAFASVSQPIVDPPSRLVFPAGVSGINITNALTVTMEDMGIYSQSTVLGTDDGIHVQGSRFKAANVLVKGFGRHGVHIDSTTYFADFWTLDAVRSMANKGDGFHWSGGADGNVGTALSPDATSNNGYGFNLDSGVNSSTFINAHGIGNTLGDYRVNAAVGNIFIAPYGEGDGTGTMLFTANASSNRVFTSLFGEPTITDTNPGGNIICRAAGCVDPTVAPGAGAARPTNYTFRSGVANNGWLDLVDTTDGHSLFRFDPNSQFLYLDVLNVHGTSDYIQKSDNTGTIAHPAMFAADGSLTDTPGVTSDGANGLTATGTVAAGAVTAPNIVPVNTAQTTKMATSGWTEQDSFGDSVTYGVGASNLAQGGTSYVARINTKVGSPTLNNYGLGGDMQCDTTAKIFNNINPGAASTALVTMMDGINDAATYGVGGYEPVFSLCENAAITWGTIPSTYKKLGSYFTGSMPTNWSADTTYTAAPGIKTTTNGAASVWPYTTTYLGQPLVVWYRIIDGNGGQFSAVDDWANGNIVYAANTTSQPQATKNGGTSSVGVLYLYSNTRTARSGTVTITDLSATSGSNIVSIIGVGVVPPQGSSNPMWVGGVMPQLNDFSSQSTYVYNQDSQDNVSYNQSLGLAVNWVDVRSCIFGTPAEMAASPNQQYHPSDAGHQELANCFLGTTHQARKAEPKFKPTLLPPWIAARTASVDFVSATDDVVVENNASGVAVTLLPSGAAYNTPLMAAAGAAGPGFQKLITVENFSTTGSVTFTAGQGVTLYPNLSGFTLAPKQVATIIMFYQGPATYYSLFSSSGGSAFAPNQSTPQAIQTSSTALTSAYIMPINGSTIGGWNVFANNSSGNWTCSSNLGDTSGGVEFGYCGTVTSIPSTTPTIKKTYVFQANTTNTGNSYYAQFNQASFTTGSPTFQWPDVAGATVSVIVGDGSGPTSGNIPTYAGGAKLSHTGLVPLGAGGVPTMTASTPANNAVCTAGQLWFDASYVYICTASGTVKRATLATF